MKIKGLVLNFILMTSITLVYVQFVQAGTCSGTCKWCGQYNEIPCGSWTCVNGGKTNSDQITKLPTGSIRNSSIVDDDGCGDNYPAPQNIMPFTIEGAVYKTIPTTVAYTINVCTCQ